MWQAVRTYVPASDIQIGLLLHLGARLPQTPLQRALAWFGSDVEVMPEEVKALRRFASEPLFRLAVYDACDVRGLWPDKQTKDCPTVEALGRLVNRLKIPARMKGIVPTA